MNLVLSPETMNERIAIENHFHTSHQPKLIFFNLEIYYFLFLKYFVPVLQPPCQLDFTLPFPGCFL